ncbi:MAG: hypothetical protein KAY54_08810 [Burkholderiaceae bacterium]|nr:hypothetical protein [Burkholderiaceae bacterium]
MRRVVRYALVALLAWSASAAAFGTYRAGSIVLDQGDSIARVMDAMGQPAYKEPVMNRYGAQVAENWFYRDGSKMVKFTISGGVVQAIEEIRQ